MTKVICVETGRVFNSLGDAAEFAGVTPRNIYAAARGDVLSSGGYHWRYACEMVQDKQARPKSKPRMDIWEVQMEAQRRTEETGVYTRYADIQKEETLRMIQERDKKIRKRMKEAKL